MYCCLSVMVKCMSSTLDASGRCVAARGGACIAVAADAASWLGNVLLRVCCVRCTRWMCGACGCCRCCESCLPCCGSICRKSMHSSCVLRLRLNTSVCISYGLLQQCLLPLLVLLLLLLPACSQGVAQRAGGAWHQQHVWSGVHQGWVHRCCRSCCTACQKVSSAYNSQVQLAAYSCCFVRSTRAAQCGGFHLLQSSQYGCVFMVTTVAADCLVAFMFCSRHNMVVFLQIQQQLLRTALLLSCSAAVTVRLCVPSNHRC
jgi:hypothetical protein